MLGWTLRRAVKFAFVDFLSFFVFDSLIVILFLFVCHSEFVMLCFEKEEDVMILCNI